MGLDFLWFLVRIKAMRVLIVEDELIIAEYIKGVLEDEGHEVLSVARNYSEALDSFQKNNPNIVLLDINLGEEKNGFHVAKKIQESSNTAIVLVSGNTTKEFIDEAKALNPNGFLSKPVKGIDLVLAVELAYNSFVKNSQMNNEIASLVSSSQQNEQSYLLRSFIHDMMNPISSLKHQVSRAPSLNEEDRDGLKNKVNLVIDILKSFREIVKKQDSRAQKISIPNLCKKIDLINRYQCLSQEIELIISPLDEEVYGIESELLRVFSNLINNSVEAIELSKAKDAWIEIAFIKVEDQIKAMVTDSGEGIQEDYREKLFTESFSTKGMTDHSGAGLGLYSARESLRRYRHEISYNENSKNTQFVIEFYER